MPTKHLCKDGPTGHLRKKSTAPKHLLNNCLTCGCSGSVTTVRLTVSGFVGCCSYLNGTWDLPVTTSNATFCTFSTTVTNLCGGIAAHTLSVTIVPGTPQLTATAGSANTATVSGGSTLTDFCAGTPIALGPGTGTNECGTNSIDFTVQKL